MSTVLGVDGCPDGWIGALVTGRRVRWLLLPDPAAVLAVPADAVAVDMPIGLPESGRRACDLLAKRALGVAHARVFLAPPRAVLGASSYAEAGPLSVAAGSRGLSRQTWGLVPKIRALDAALTPAMAERVVEAHPELSFAALAGRPLARKTSGRGVGERLAALAGFVDAVAALRELPAGTRTDDALDALACAWTARRWAQGDAATLPDGCPRDRRGLPMRIVT